MHAYDGTNWEEIDGTSVMFAITGVTTSDLWNVFVHKARLYYIEKNAMSLWYPAIGALGGARSRGGSG